MFQVIILLLLGAIGAVLFLASRKPDSFRTTRSSIINASPEKVLALISDFHQWEKWSPWAKMDLSAINTFSGADKGVGAQFAWQGNNKVGQGKMELLNETAEKIDIRITFLKPFAATNSVEFTALPKGNATELTWTMYGPQKFINKIMATVIDCDAMVGGQFEQGLASLKAEAEKT